MILKPESSLGVFFKILNPEVFAFCILIFSFSFDLKFYFIYFLVHEHYQKIDKYKRKYRGNIFVGKLPMDFTDGNIPSVFTEGITVGKKKIKTKQRK